MTSTHAREDAWRFTLGKSGQRKLLAIGLNPLPARNTALHRRAHKMDIARAEGIG
jgi:hypothetical protein